MKHKTVTLLSDATNVHLSKNSNSVQTVIHYNSAKWPGKVCIYVVPGVWKIESVEGNEVSLVNEDEVQQFNTDSHEQT